MSSYPRIWTLQSLLLTSHCPLSGCSVSSPLIPCQITLLKVLFTCPCARSWGDIPTPQLNIIMNALKVSAVTDMIRIFYCLSFVRVGIHRSQENSQQDSISPSWEGYTIEWISRWNSKIFCKTKCFKLIMKIMWSFWPLLMFWAQLF